MSVLNWKVGIKEQSSLAKTHFLFFIDAGIYWLKTTTSRKVKWDIFIKRNLVVNSLQAEWTSKGCKICIAAYNQNQLGGCYILIWPVGPKYSSMQNWRQTWSLKPRPGKYQYPISVSYRIFFIAENQIQNMWCNVWFVPSRTRHMLKSTYPGLYPKITVSYNYYQNNIIWIVIVTPFSWRVLRAMHS